ncbi:MAG: pilus assembly protein PilP [Magnetococcales bacterium]|nr:pilus assembly protein PilP [Magnetococcales bacterium]
MKPLPVIVLVMGIPLAATAGDPPPPEEAHYRFAGTRDPFQPPASLERRIATGEKEAPKVKERPKEPLEAFQLDSLKLVAILFATDHKEAAAMVQDPSGKGHVIRVQNYIGMREGQVMEIGNGIVIIREPQQAKAGDYKTITLRLHEEKAK